MQRLIAAGIIDLPRPEVGQLVYRVFGGDAHSGGASWTPVKPRDVPDFRFNAGLPTNSEGGTNNSAELLMTARITDTAGVVNIRTALPLDGNNGGIIEYIIPSGGLSSHNQSIEILSTEFF